jgi:Mg-chelatase subunit ChlD
MKRIFTIIFLYCPFFIFAQQNPDLNFHLEGKIIDQESNQAIPNAKISIINFAGKANFPLISNDSGLFEINMNAVVRNGEYSITIEKDGFYPINGFILIKNNGKRVFSMKKIQQTKPTEFLKPLETPIKPSETLSQKDSIQIINKESLEGFATNNLIFLIDVSSSMNQPDKLPILKDAIKYLTNLYRPTDKIAILTYSGVTNEILPSTFVNDKIKIFSAIDGINAGGASQGGNALEKAYQTAIQNYISNGNNRIVLATDGMFTNGEKEDKKILNTIQNGLNNNIYLSIFSFGQETYKAKIRLTNMAIEGKGNYVNIKTLETAKEHLLIEAKSILGQKE